MHKVSSPTNSVALQKALQRSLTRFSVRMVTTVRNVSIGSGHMEVPLKEYKFFLGIGNASCNSSHSSCAKCNSSHLSSEPTES